MNVLLLLQKEFMKTKICLPAFFYFSLLYLPVFYISFSSPLLFSQCILSPMTNSLVFVLCISSEVIFCFFLSLSSSTLLYITLLLWALPLHFYLFWKFSCLPPLVTAAAFILLISACQTNGNRDITAQHNTQKHSTTQQHNNIQENIRH